MNLATVAVKNMRRNMFRTVLTLIGVAIAILAFVLLRTVLSAWTMGAEYAAQDRVATRHKVTFVMTLPRRYVRDVTAVDGVQEVTWLNWFGGKLPGHEDQFFANMATDPESFLRVYDEVELPAEQEQAWLENRRGAIVGRTLANQFGWEVGDRITLRGTIFPGDWEMHVSGIYTASRKSLDQSSLFFHWDYLNEGAPESMQERVGWIVSRIDDAGASATIAERIDKAFDTRDVQTLSMSERALNASFLGMLSTLLKALDVVSVVVLGIMMLILGNTIAMGARERVREYGTLRAIGFMPKHIAAFILGESAAVGALGAALGIGMAYPLINGGLSQFVEENFTTFFPYFRLMGHDVALAAAAGLLLALLAGAIPAYTASKVNVTRALRHVA